MPASEPSQAGTTFSCSIVVINTGARFIAQARVTDDHGDVLVTALDPQPSSSGVSAAPTTVPTTVPPTQPTVPVTAPPAAAVLTGPPTRGQVAVISVNPAGNELTLDTGSAQDVTYKACAQFHAVAPGGAPAGLSALVPGDFATDAVDVNVPCVSQLSILNAPAPPQCSTSGLGGAAAVTWEGFNQSAHAVLYLPSGPGEAIVADRWCTTPTVVGASNAAVGLSQIPKGAQVELTLSNHGWITAVTVKS